MAESIATLRITSEEFIGGCHSYFKGTSSQFLIMTNSVFRDCGRETSKEYLFEVLGVGQGLVTRNTFERNVASAALLSFRSNTLQMSL